MPDVPDGLLTHICRIKGLYTPDACICVDHFNAKYLFWSADWHFHTECWYNEASVLYYHFPCSQGSRASCSPPRGHPVQRSHHLSPGYVENPTILLSNFKIVNQPDVNIRLSLRHNLKSKFSKWRPEHSEHSENPSFCHKTVGNHLLRKNCIRKNCSSIILLHLPLFTSLQQFSLCARTKLSHLISPTAKGIRLVSQSLPRQSRLHTTAIQDPPARTSCCHHHLC